MANPRRTQELLTSDFFHRKGNWTFEEFCDLIEDGQKADLLSGVVHMASPDNTDAGQLTTWMTTVVNGFVEERDLGDVYICRIAYRIGSKNGPEPDIAFVARKYAKRRRRGYIAGPPTVAIEIVSPESVARDYIEKRAIYQQAGVQEYWIIDPDAGRVTFLFLRDGQFEEMTPVAHVFHSKVLKGFHLDVRWLLGRRRPRAYRVLKALLAEMDQ